MTRVSSKDTSACYAIIICIHPKGKILERWTKEEIRMFEALFEGTRFGLRTIEKRFEKIGFPLLFIVPKSSFGEHNDAIILWVQQTHYHAIIIVWLVWVRMTHRHAIIICDHHLVSSTDTLSCYHHRMTRVSSNGTSACITARTHAPLTRQTHNDT